jgi:hypothetical protein
MSYTDDRFSGGSDFLIPYTSAEVLLLMALDAFALPVAALAGIFWLALLTRAVFRSRRFPTCSYCGARKVARLVHLRGLDFAAAATGLIPLLCKGCRRKYYGMRGVNPRPEVLDEADYFRVPAATAKLEPLRAMAPDPSLVALAAIHQPPVAEPEPVAAPESVQKAEVQNQLAALNTVLHDANTPAAEEVRVRPYRCRHQGETRPRRGRTAVLEAPTKEAAAKLKDRPFPE